MLGLVDYIGFLHVANVHHGFMSMVSNMAHMSVDEGVYENNSMENGRRWMQSSKQKSVPLIKELVWKFSIPGDLVLDSFVKMLYIAKGCIFLHN